MPETSALPHPPPGLPLVTEGNPCGKGGGDLPLGIFGGAFDPVHYGHLRLAEEARKALGLSEVRWIPAGRPAHRAPPAATADQRLAMLRLGLAGNPSFNLDEGEVRSSDPSYSVPTLERLRAECGAQRPLVLLLGADAFLGLSTWRRWQELFDLAHLAVATRPGYSFEDARMPPPLAAEFERRETLTADALAATPAGHILVFPITPLDISATALRALFRAKGSGRYLLPDSVVDYIAAHHIYQ